MEQRDPVCIVHFADGHETCTAVYCAPDALDLARALELARRARRKAFALALESSENKRARGVEDEGLEERIQLFRDRLKLDPKIVSARFEFRGEVLRTYDADDIAAADASGTAEVKQKPKSA